MVESPAVKRQHLRLSAMGAVELLTQDRPPEEAYLASIGRGGLGIYCTSALKANQLLLLNLRLVGQPDGTEGLKVATRVRWACPAGRLYMAGLAFERMSDARFAKLLEHMQLLELWQLGNKAREGRG